GCVGKCAHVPRLRIDAQRSDLIMHLDVNTGTRVVMPLPGHENQWLATSVVINGIPAPALQRRSGVLWVAVDKGHHQIIIRGPINQTSNVQLNLPLTPGFTTFHGDGWLLNGLHED